MTTRQKDIERLTSSNAARTVWGYLMKTGLTKQTCRNWRVALCDEALENAQILAFNRIYTAIFKTCLNLGADEEHAREFMAEFDNVCNFKDKANDATYWSDLMAEVYNTTGIVIRTGSDDKFTEFITPEELAEYQREQNDRAARGLKAEKYEGV